MSPDFFEDGDQSPYHRPRLDRSIIINFNHSALCDMSNQCSICQKSFVRLEHLRRHVHTHTTDKPFVCDHCGKSFARRDALQRHGTVHRSVTSASPDADDQPASKRRRLSHERCSPNLSQPSESLHSGILGNENEIELADIMGPVPPLARQFDRDPKNDRSRRDATRKTAKTLSTNWLPFDETISPESNKDEAASSPALATQGKANASGPSPVGLLVDTNSPGNAPANAMMPFVAAMGGGLNNLRASTIPIASTRCAWSSSNLPDERYTSGSGARLSNAESFHRQRLSMRNLTRQSQAPDDDEHDSRTPESKRSQAVTLRPGLFHVPDQVYSDIEARFNTRIRIKLSEDGPRSVSSTVLDRTRLDDLIQLYFTNFHPVYPFLDQPLMSMRLWGWSLCLATASIGCRYDETVGANELGDDLAIVLREMLVNELEVTRIEKTLPFIQAMVLNCISLCCSGSTDGALMSIGYDIVPSVMQAALRFNLFDEIDMPNITTSATDLDQAWMAWRCRETRRRTGLFIWVTDCVLATMHASDPLLSLQALNLLLPTREELWTADSAEKWLVVQEAKADVRNVFSIEEHKRHTFKQAYSRMWRQQEMVPGASQMACSTLVYGLMHRSYHVRHHFDDPGWIEVGNQDGTSPSPFSPLYLPAVSDFSQWRNAACDSLDAVHWDALARVAKNKTIEGPLVLDLHFARLILLAPNVEMLNLILLKAQGGSDTETRGQLPHSLTSSSKSIEQLERVIRIWRRRDAHKARLAVVHAGAVFWHVRHFPSDSFMQPFALYLATLVLWHFCVPESINDRNGQNPSNAPSQIDHQHDPGPGTICDTPQSGPSSVEQTYSTPTVSEIGPKYLNIDRPMDDPMVQYFVRNGVADATLCALGIDDLCTTKGITDLVRQGITLLKDSSKNSWPLVSAYATSLGDLIRT